LPKSEEYSGIRENRIAFAQNGGSLFNYQQQRTRGPERNITYLWPVK
jgi:hypothetical protein